VSVVLGIALVVLGFLALASPLVSGIAIAYMVGFLVVVGGITQSIFAFRAASLGRGVLRFLLGGLMVVCGLSMIAHPLLGLSSLTLVLAMYFVADGIVRSLYAFDLRPAQGWVWMLVGGIVSIVLGGLIWSEWPLSGTWAVGVLVGINLLMSGWTLIMLGPIVERAASELASRTEGGSPA
jgi:uncharacterized membrane protein HdeD (DUF308 family)